MAFRHPNDFQTRRFLELARELRQRQTPAEEMLWTILRGRKLMGLKFRRQHRIYNYVVDFYCYDLKLVIELDGAVHQTQEQLDRDVNRDIHLENLGYRIQRFSNHEVESDLCGVLGRIMALADSL